MPDLILVSYMGFFLSKGTSAQYYEQIVQFEIEIDLSSGEKGKLTSSA